MGHLSFMSLFLIFGVVIYLELTLFSRLVSGAMTMPQMYKMMETMRTTCSAKFKVTNEEMDGLKVGKFDDNNKELKCYTFCVAQMAGTLSKKNEVSEKKSMAQIEKLLPEEIKEYMIGAVQACKDVQKDYKEPCDRTFYTSKCMYEFDPKQFLFP